MWLPYIYIASGGEPTLSGATHFQIWLRCHHLRVKSHSGPRWLHSRQNFSPSLFLVATAGALRRAWLWSRILPATFLLQLGGAPKAACSVRLVSLVVAFGFNGARPTMSKGAIKMVNEMRRGYV